MMLIKLTVNGSPWYVRQNQDELVLTQAKYFATRFPKQAAFKLANSNRLFTLACGAFSSGEVEVVAA
jgi:hypothetical protein